MVHARRRFLFPAAVVFVIVLLGAGGSFHGRFTPQSAHAVNEDANVSFDPVSPVAPLDPALTVNPPRLYAGDLSHVLPARGLDDPLGTNGYCVTLHTGGLTPAGSQATLGFTLVGTDPIDPTTQPATVNVQIPGVIRLTNVDGQANVGALTGVAGPANLPTANGDKYCIVAQAPVGYKTLKVNWTYIDTSNIQHTVTLNDPTFIPVVTVTLKGSAIGTAGLVCTVGWDPTFLTGNASDTPPVSPGSPDPLDVVTFDANVVNPNDFVVNVIGAGTATITSVQRDATDSTQWCASITIPAGSPVTVNVKFKFDSVYNRLIPGDNQLHVVQLSDNAPPNNQLVIPGALQLAHIGANGQVLTDQMSPALVIGAREIACVLGSDAADTLLPSDINFSDVSGAPDHATVAALTVFHTGGPGAILPISGQQISVAVGTLCFSYVSSSAGEHGINLTFTDNPGANLRTVSWTNGALFVQWNRIDSTVMNTGGTLDSPPVTFGAVHVPVTFNLADGTFLAAQSRITEFVLGSHHAQSRLVSGSLDGAVLRASLSAGCGYFVVPDNSQPRAIDGLSVGGRFELSGHGDTDGNPDDLTIDIQNDRGCTPGQAIRLSVDVLYPGSATPALPTEYVDIILDQVIPPAKTPRIAWIGDTVSITYAVSSNTSCEGTTVHFVRPKDQRGTFLASTGVNVVGNDEALADFGAGCSATVNFVSVDPGEVDIEVFTDESFTKVAFPIFYLALEDITLTATDTSVVSTVGEVDTVVRGWFVGTNPSGHPAATTADGRHLPADRWTLPDDWDTLSGSATGARTNWGSAQMPPVAVHFLMQNESVVNNYATGVKNGGAGWFMPFTTQNPTPEVGRIPDANGVVPMPRTFTDLSDSNGITDVLTFGDKNLSYEGCAKSAINANPLCKPTDVVGHTVYYAVADYIHEVGKYPPIMSNTGTTEWTWAGYKAVTIVPGETPQYKYVVAHLRDRDGYCDAAAFNNTLGIRVRFEIDSGGGVIIDAAGAPVTISNNKHFATATTFDTQDDQGKAINTAIAKPVFDPDNPDECQAWIKVSDSLLDPTNVLVTFEGPPAAIPGDIRITGLSCNPFNESVTVTNKGTTTVSLDGFALRSLPSDPVAQEEHLGLTGVLAPAQSVTFLAGPAAVFYGWLRSNDSVFQGGPNDYARLVWNGFEIDRQYCSGLFNTPQIANPLPPDGEGETVLDVVIPFGQEREIPLVEGWNILPASSVDNEFADVLTGNEDNVAAIYGWDATNETWLTYIPGAGSVANTLDKLHAGQAYWVLVNHPFTLIVMK